MDLVDGFCEGWLDQWTTTIIDDTTGVEPEGVLRVDSSGALHVMHFNTNTDRLRYTTNASGDWASGDLSLNGAVVQGSASMNLDASDAVHLSYMSDATGTMYHATNASGSWSYSEVDASVGRGDHSAVAVDASGAIHVAYSMTLIAGNVFAEYYYATDASGTWVITEVEPTIAGLTPFLRMEIDANGSPHMIYLDEGFTLSHAWWSSGVMESEVVDDVGSTSEGFGMTIHDDLGVVISFTRSSDERLYLTHRPSSTWEVETISEAGTVTGSSSPLVTGTVAAGLVTHVTCQDATTSALKVATHEGTTWTVTAVDTSTDAGTWSWMGVGADEVLQVGYSDATNHVLKRASNPTCSRQGDARDLDCDGLDGTDADLDGYVDEAVGGDDCDDAAIGTNPGALDDTVDGVDQDCDGTDGS